MNEVTIDYDEIVKETPTFVIPEWLAKEKGLI